MEVASPLAMAPGSTAKSKRSLACAPAMSTDRLVKRRRFHADTSVDSLTENFSAHSLWLKSLPTSQSVFSNSGSTHNSLKRSRSQESTALSETEEDVNRVVQEQATLIASLRKDKFGLETSLGALKTDHERLAKENTILRRAVTIQQERQVKTENELKYVQEQATERIRGLEQTVLTLQYHLQTQRSNVGNDFMAPTPPDVY